MLVPGCLEVVLEVLPGFEVLLCQVLVPLLLLPEFLAEVVGEFAFLVEGRCFLVLD